MTRFIRCSPVDESAVVDINARELAVGYRRDVAAALQGKDPPPEFWLELADIVTEYFIIAENRSTRNLERMQKILALIDELGTATRATDRPALSQWALISGHLLSALCTAKEFTESYIEGHQDIAFLFIGHDNPYRQKLLYDRVLELWCHRLGKKLTYGRTGSLPVGPLIRFFAAVVGPVLGEEAPGAHGIADVVKRARRPPQPPRRRRTRPARLD